MFTAIPRNCWIHTADSGSVADGGATSFESDHGDEDCFIYLMEIYFSRVFAFVCGSLFLVCSALAFNVRLTPAVMIKTVTGIQR